MYARRDGYKVSIVLGIIAIVVLAGLALKTPEASAADDTVEVFAGGATNVTLTFKGATTNSTAEVELPKGCTVEGASMDLHGIRQRGDDARALDYGDYDPVDTPHRAWRGWVQGNYPPSYPFWNPYGPHGSALSTGEYDDVGSSDDARLQTKTGTGSTGRYPFHMFRFQLPPGDLKALSVEWEGFGYCLANATTRGAEVFVWRNATRGWERVDWYSRTEAAQDRNLTAAWTQRADRYVDGDGQVFILVYGKRSQNVAGPNPWTAEGELHTDYVWVNATLAGAWEDVVDVSLGIGPQGEVWSRSGPLRGRVTVSWGLDIALQGAVDAAPVEPGNVSIPVLVNVSAPTSGLVRLSNLSVRYTPIQNVAPSWGTMPSLEMEEDEDADRLLDLAAVVFDDHSHDRLAYAVVNASTSAILAVVEDEHYLTFRVQEAHWHGRATFRINATDPWGLASTSPPLEVLVAEVNDPPSVTWPGRQSAVQGQPFLYTVQAHDVDGDAPAFADDTDVFDIDPGTGEVNFTPTNDDVGLHRVNITVSDGRGGQTVVVMELTVDNVNDPPVIRDPGPLSGRQGEDLELTMVADDPDEPYGDMLSWHVLGDDYYRNNVHLNPVTGEMAWRNIGNGDVGDHAFTVQVVDTGGGEDHVEVHLTIANVNDPPSFPHAPDMTVYEDRRFTYNLRVKDLDLDVDPAEELTWTVEPALFTITAEGVIDFVPTREQLGNHTVLVTVTDRAGESFSQALTITVKHLNHPPVLEPIPDQVVHEDVLWTLNISVHDLDEGDVVEVTSRGAPFRVPLGGGIVSWTPEQRHVGEHLVTLEATDLEGASTTVAFNLTVVLRNDPPTVVIQAPLPGQAFKKGKELFLSALVHDEEGEHVSIVWMWRHNRTPDEPWTRINTGDSVFWPKPPAGKLLLRVEATDGETTVADEVVFKVRRAKEDGEGLDIYDMVMLVIGILAVLLLVYVTLQGRTGGDEEELSPGEGEEDWEVVEDTPSLPE